MATDENEVVEFVEFENVLGITEAKVEGVAKEGTTAKAGAEIDVEIDIEI